MSKSSKSIEPEHQHFFKNISVNLKRFRLQAGLTQEKLSEIAEVSRNTISNIESCKDVYGVSLQMLFILADALKVHPIELLETEEYCNAHCSHTINNQ